MATKTFKIGLSNTDKQNMAQDVYERLLALTFPEYDTSETYAVGDFVVYNDELYKCIGATSGVWDSTKWQLATLNDLLTDIESAVAFVNDKANVDGNYPTMTVGVADQLSPYDEESGDDQDEPFNFQATGTGNGTQPDFATGAIALMKEKQGNTVVVNQLVQNGNDSFNIGTGTLTCTKRGQTLILNGEYAAGVSTQAQFALYRPIYNHKYLVYISKDVTGYASIQVNDWNASGEPLGRTYVKPSIFTSTNATNQTGGQYGMGIYINPNRVDPIVYDNYSFNVYIIDLTQWFNGDIPPDLLDNPENFFRYYQGSLAYNEGTLVNADGRYIKCIGMNQWDEEWESGGLKADGTLDDNGARRTTSFIRVTPNTTYYQKCPTSAGSGRFAYYDANKNLILFSDNGIHSNDTFVTPSNACFLRITFGVSYGITYNNDISINLYYEDEARCLTYEPYEVLTNNDTGTEVLRSAGSAKDYKDPDGTIHRNTGTQDLSQLSWTYDSEHNIWSASCPANMKTHAYETNYKPNIKSNMYVVETNDNVYIQNVPMSITASTVIRVYNGSSTTEPSGTLQYELADDSKTTEQGTPYSENLVIDDFGSMDFQGTNGVPQGNLIFYPVDYKAFIDTLYNYTKGTPSELALKSDLATAPQTWAESLPGYDATKTQTLKNVEGTLTWVDDE